MNYDLSQVLGKVVKFLKETMPSLVSVIIKTAFGLTGVYGWIAAYIAKKASEELLKEADDAVDTIQNKAAIEELKKEMMKPLKEINWKRVDELEKEILEGK